MNDDDLNAGRELIVAADRAHVPLRAAFWLFDSDGERWRLVLEAEPERHLGIKEFAAELHAAVRTIPEERAREQALDLLLGAAVLATRPHPIGELLRPSLGAAKSVMRARLGNNRVGDGFIEGAVLYRLERAQTM